MAKYRISKRRDGTWDVVATLGEKGAAKRKFSVLRAKEGSLDAAVLDVAEQVVQARGKRNITQGNPGEPEVTQ